MVSKRIGLGWVIFLLIQFFAHVAFSQGNKLSIQGTGPKNLSVCGFDDTARITVYNISASTITGNKITLTLPTGINYVKGSFIGTGIAESNVTNLNKPIFSGPNLVIGQYFTFVVKLTANCDLIPLLSGTYTPDIGIRVDYTGNYDVGTSSPFVPIVPSPGFASITNASFTGNIGDVFVRKITITNFGKGTMNAVRFMRINGSDLKNTPQKGFTNVVKGDTVWTFFTTTDIKKVGDLDTLFEQNETLIIYDTVRINGCNKLSAYFELAWGCGGKLCQFIKNSGAVTISSDNPILNVWPTSVSKLCFDGTTANAQALTVTNTGKKDAKSTRVFVYTPYGSSNCRIDTATVWAKKGYKGKLFRVYPDSCYQPYYVASCMPNFSVTYMQLRLPTIAPKDTIYISFDMYRCADASCGFAFYDLGWVYSYEYRNQCNSLSAVGAQWGRVYSPAWGQVSTWVPTDLAKDETKDFRFSFSSFYATPLDKTGQIRVDLVLPKTLTHSLSKSDFFIVNYNLTSTWYPDSIAWRKDTLRAFYGNAFAFDMNNAELTVRLKGICSAYNGNASLPVNMSVYYNPQPSCNPYIWIRPICVWFNTKVHCSNSCNGGMQFKNFELYRSSYGLPDNNNDGTPDKTGSLDLTKIRQERAMYGDTITSVFVGRPKNTSGISTWRYGYAESFVTYGYYLDVVDARLVSIKGGTISTGNCNKVRVKKIPYGGHATFQFDFSVDSIYPKGCLPSTYKYTNNDSLRLIVRYKVTGNISAQGVLANFSNRFYLGSVANPAFGQWYQCDSFSGNMMIYGYYLYNCCGDNMVYSNCAEVAIHQGWYNALGAWSYAGNNLFPYEYRPWSKIKSLRIFLPSNLAIKNTYYGQYRTTGTGSYLLEQVNGVQPVKGSTNPIVFDFTKTYKDSGGTIQTSDDGVQGYLYYTVQAKCNTPNNVPQRIDYEYVFERQGTWGKGYDTMFSKSIGTSDNFTFVAPKLNLTPQIATVYATKDTVDWIVSYSNPSSTFSAYNVWLSPRSNSNINVVEVRDFDKDTVIKPTNDLYKAGVLASGLLRRFKIRAVYNSCAPDSLVLFGSYDCSDYPADFASYPCSPIRTTLFLEPQNTRLQLTLTDSTAKTDLCATNKMTLQVENIQSVQVYNTKIRISLPIGMTIVNNSASLKYPLSASATSIGQPTLISGTIYEWDLAKLNAAISKGFIGTSDTSKNKLRIVFRVATDCDYASGSFISARALSNIKCGDPVPASPAYSNALDIKGVTRPYFTLVKSWADTLLPCEKAMDIRVRVVFLGPSKSAGKDRVEFFLPKGITRDTSYFKAIRNSPNKDSLFITTINGATLLSWVIPKNIVPGDSLEFAIRTTGTGSLLSCGVTDVLARSVVIQPVVCITTGKACDIKVITGSELVTPMIDKGSLDIIPSSISSNLVSVDSEDIVLKYLVKNNGRYMNGTDPIKVKLFYDANNNGKWDNADKYLGYDSTKKTLAIGATISFTKKLRVKAGYSCAILAAIDSAACSCKFGQRRFGVPRLINAGRDTAICSGANLKLGTYTVKNFYYFWDNYLVLDDRLLGTPSFIGKNNNNTPDTNTLVLTTNRGFCSSKDTVVVYVYPLPKVKVGLKDTQVCLKSNISVSGKITGGTGKILAQWQPAADCVTPKSTTTLIRVSGNIAYKLYGIDQNGCTAVDSVRVKVFPFPKTGFIVPLTCSGSDPVLTDTTTISSGKIVTSEWKSASLDTFNAKSITLLMGAASYKKVTLIEVSDIGCSDTLTKIVSVKANPHAAFTVKYVCLGDSSRFIPQCFVDSGKITSYSWDFSGGQTSGLSAPAFKFSSAKDYRVLLSIKTNWSCSDTISAVARVFPNPKAAFTVADVCAKDSLRFINGSNLKGDTLLTYNWNLGGLGLAKNTNPSVYVKNAGNYPGKLLVTTIHGCKDSVSATVKANPLPTAKFGLNNNCLGLSSVFTDSSSIVAGNIVAYKWQFGDGNSSLAPNPTNTYKTAGTFNVKFNVVSDAGCKDSLTKAIQIYPLAKPSFSVADLCIGENFISAAKINGTGKVVAYKWYFGNGDSAITPNINYLYKAIGVYQVQLKVITDKGCLNDSIAAIEISQKPIVAANSSNPCNDDSIIFNGSAQVTAGFVTTTVWKLSNGVTNLNKKFAAHMVPKGPISGTFYAITNKGCTDSAKTATVIQSPVVVKFSVADVCLDEVSIFKDQSLSAEPITRYAWNFGDGKGSALQNPPYTYRKDGNWNVDLLIETKPGCVYSTTQIAVVHPKPVPAFTISPNTTTIVNPNITIADISSGADTMWYEITDGYATNKRNFVHTFPDSGSFEIWQYTANRFGCLDSTHIPIVIFFTYTLHVPNVFTPNADGKNETFGPQGMGLAWYSMRIYDRWGGLVYQTEDSKPWDGSYMGETVMDGVYSVLINIRDYKRKPHYYRGTVKVLR